MEPWIAILAKKTGRPVKIVFTREEDLNTSTIRHAYKMIYKTGASKDGKLLANQVTIWADSGAYLGLGKSTLTKATVHVCGPYYFRNVKVDSYLVYTNALIGSSMRGMGIPQVCFAIESQLDILAEELGMDRFDLRRANMFDHLGHLPNGQMISGGPMRGTFERAWEIFNDKSRWKD